MIRKSIYILFLLSFNLFGAICTWIGNANGSTDWNTAANWTGGVPTVADNAVIATVSGVGKQYPTLPTSPAAICKKLTINSGATLNGGSGNLTIQLSAESNGGFIATGGTFNYETSTVILKPFNTRTNGKIPLTAVTNFYNLEISATSRDDGQVRFATIGTYTVHNDFTFTRGQLDMGGNSMVVGGTVYNASAALTFINSTTSYLKMTGSEVAFSPSDYYMDLEMRFDPGSSNTITIDGVQLQCRNVQVLSGTFNLYVEVADEWLNMTTGVNNSVAGNITVSSGATLEAGNSTVTAYYGGNVTVNGTLNLSDLGNLQVASGHLTGTNSGAVINANASSIIVGKNFDFAGTFNEGTSTVTFESSSESRITNGRQFYNLVFNKLNSTDIIRPISLDNIVSFTNDLTWNGGYFYRGGLQTTKSSSFDIANYCGMTLNSSGNVTITKYTQALPPGTTPNAIKNFLVISNANQNVGAIKSYYQGGGNNDELITGFSNSAGRLRAWRSINAGTLWTKVGTTDEDDESSVGYTGSPAATSGITTYFAFMDNISTSLPVEFDSTYFYANNMESGVELKWLTHSEENLKGFIIYRSTSLTDGFTEIDSWITNDKLRSANDGNSTNDTYYSYIDTKVEEGTTYYYRLKAYCSENDQEFHPKTISVTYEGLCSNGLAQNYPNPFNSQTTIKYIVGKELPVSLVVFNSNGQTVKELFSGIQKKGIYSVSMNGGDIASGMYYYRLKVGDQTFMKKMISIK